MRIIRITTEFVFENAYAEFVKNFCQIDNFPARANLVEYGFIIYGQKNDAISYCRNLRNLKVFSDPLPQHLTCGIPVSTGSAPQNHFIARLTAFRTVFVYFICSVNGTCTHVSSKLLMASPPPPFVL